jgi:hypothetical protein
MRLPLILVGMALLLPAATWGQLTNNYTCGWGADALSTPVSCATGCIVSGGGPTSAESQDPSGSGNQNFSGRQQTLNCVAPPSNPSLSCSPVGYFAIAEDDQDCGVCPDCSNKNCSNFVDSSCCADNSCGIDGICFSCSQECVQGQSSPGQA